MFYLILSYIVLFSFFNNLLYWKQLKDKTLTKLLGRKAFKIWLICDIFLIIVLIALLLIFFVFYPQKKILPEAAFIKLVAFILFLAGSVIVLLASRKLGFYRAFSQAIFTRKRYEVIKRGVFRLLRHPMYFGFSLIFLAGVLYLNSAYALIFFIVWIIHFSIRARLEERELEFL